MLTFTSNGGNSFVANVSQYPYGPSQNVIFTSPCQQTTAAIQTPALIPGMLYRWNMYSYGGSDCTSCQSAVSLTNYFSLPPQITSPVVQLPQGGLITISTPLQKPGSGATVNYRWLKDGNAYKQGALQDTIIVSTAGNYSLIIDYSGSADCGSTVSTSPSNVIAITSNISCTPSTAGTTITSNPVTGTNGSVVQLSVTGGSLGTNASWKWYKGGCGQTYITSGQSIQVSTSVGQTYYVRAEGDCGFTTCDSIAIRPNINGGCTPSVTPDSIRHSILSNSPNGPNIQLTVVGGSLGTNAQWQWYQGGCGSSAIIGTGSSITVNPSVTTEYFVRAEGCDTSACVNATIGITPNCNYTILPTSIVPSTNNVQPGTSVQLNLIGGTLGENANWELETGSCGGPVIASNRGTSFTVAPTTTTTYYLTSIGQCNIGECVKVTVNVVSAPTISSVTPNPAENGTKVTITGSGFDQSAAVTFRGTAALSDTVINATTIVAVVGSGSSGDVVVTTDDGVATFSGFNYTFTLPTDNFQISVTAASCIGHTDGQIVIKTKEPLSYSAAISGSGASDTYFFQKTQTIGNLAAGKYQLCLSVNGETYQQCDSLVVGQPPPLSVYASIKQDIHSLQLVLSGGSEYNINLNGQAYYISSSTFTLPL